MTTFSQTVEAWRPLVMQHGSDMPIDFLLAWIAHESGGRPCSIGACGDAAGTTVKCSYAGAQYVKEIGLFQLYFSTPTSTSPLTGGATYPELRAYCSGLGQTQTRALTSAEQIRQINSGLNYVRYERDKTRNQLAVVGVDWGSSKDFWKMVKLQHGLPSIPKAYLPKFKEKYGRGPTSWTEFVSIVPYLTNPLYAKVLLNAQNTGEYALGTKLSSAGVGFGGLPGWAAAVLGVGLAATLWGGARWWAGREARTLRT